MRHAKIPLADYSRAVRDFNPDPDYAKKLVKAAKDAGMK